MTAAPFFETGAGHGGRRLLLVSYHFPPGGAAGALRWQKLAPFVAMRGWDLDVITAPPPAGWRADDAALSGLPRGVRLFAAEAQAGLPERIDRLVDAVSALRPGRRRGARREGPAPSTAEQRRPAPVGENSVAPEGISWLAVNRRMPSRAYTSWLMRARELAWARGAIAVSRHLGEARYAAVISCGPPHQAHEAGREIAAAWHVPFIMDLRDPWSIRRRVPEPYASPLYFQLARRDERRSVHAAALVVANTDELRDAMLSAYPDRRISTVMNGWDDEAVPRPSPGQRFLIGYAGSIYLDRDPRPLLAALGQVVAQRSLSPDRIGLELMGSVHGFGGATLESLAAQEGVADFVKVHQRQPRAEALRFMASASVLVSLPQDSPLAVPSKIFEYMPFPAWLLALASPGTPTARLLAGTDADVVPPHDRGAIAAALLRRYDAFARGERPAPLRGGERYSRRHQAAILLEALHEVAGPP